MAEQQRVLDVFTIDQASSTPPFRQLHNAVVAAVSAGTLVPGQRVPTVRALAEHLGLATNTVANAYKSLEAAGLLEGRGRSGSFISTDEDPLAAAARRVATDAVSQLAGLGITGDAAEQVLREAIRAQP